jgi:hypothetical protein
MIQVPCRPGDRRVAVAAVPQQNRSARSRPPHRRRAGTTAVRHGLPGVGGYRLGRGLLPFARRPADGVLPAPPGPGADGMPVSSHHPADDPGGRDAASRTAVSSPTLTRIVARERRSAPAAAGRSRSASTAAWRPRTGKVFDGFPGRFDPVDGHPKLRVSGWRCRSPHSQGGCDRVSAVTVTEIPPVRPSPGRAPRLSKLI